MSRSRFPLVSTLHDQRSGFSPSSEEYGLPSSPSPGSRSLRRKRNAVRPRSRTSTPRTPISHIWSRKTAPSPICSAALTDRTIISLIEAMMPASRNGSARSSRLATVTRTAKSQLDDDEDQQERVEYLERDAGGVAGEQRPDAACGQDQQADRGDREQGRDPHVDDRFGGLDGQVADPGVHRNVLLIATVRVLPLGHAADDARNAGNLGRSTQAARQCSAPSRVVPGLLRNARHLLGDGAAPSYG